MSSSENDPGLVFEHPNYKSFEIGEGFCRDWLFANIDADVLVMTMPDLHQYQVKKSSHSVHYVYVQHSLVSLHMVYRPRAFEYYDTIFCAGPHHVKELRAMEKRYGYRPKKVIEHGYARLDSIISNRNSRSLVATGRPSPNHVLLAPSWGKQGIIECGLAFRIVGNLLTRGFKVTLRPHPQTLKFARTEILQISKEFKHHPLFTIEDNVAGEESLHASDLMVSDWSGAALDYALGLNKPVIFIDGPKKINDPDYERLGIVPLEIRIRDTVGMTVPADCSVLPVDECLRIDNSGLDLAAYVFNVGGADEAGARAIVAIMNT